MQVDSSLITNIIRDNKIKTAPNASIVNLQKGYLYEIREQIAH